MNLLQELPPDILNEIYHKKHVLESIPLRDEIIEREKNRHFNAWCLLNYYQNSIIVNDLS